MKVLRRVACAAALSTAVLGGLGAWGSALARRFAAESARGLAAARAVRGVERLAARVRDAESGQRGFLLTGDPAYLEAYDDAVAATGRAPALPAGGTWPEAESAALRAVAADKLAELAETVALARAGRRDEAVAVVRSGRGRELMRHVRRRAERMAALADAEAAARAAAAARSLALARVAFPLAGVAVPLAAFGSVAASYVQARALARARADAEAALLRAKVEADVARAGEARMAALLNQFSHDLRTPMNAVAQHLALGEAMCERDRFDRVAVWNALGDARRGVRSQADLLADFLAAVGRRPGGAG